MPREHLIDDFQSGGGVSPLGTQWRCFTDQVMGGASEAHHDFETIEDEPCIRLRGRVSLENNGGFVQVALPLEPGGGALDASSYEGVRLRVRGNGERYYVHLRTRDTRLPWQYYAVSFEAGDAWKTIALPFEDFEPVSIAKPLAPGALTRVAIVAAKRAFDADVAAAKVAFYRETPAG